MNKNIGIGEYRKEDYQEILSLSKDRDNLDATWEDWKKNKKNAVKRFRKMGVKTIDIIVIPKELVQYCRENGLEINGDSRAAFISYKVSRLNF